MEPLPESLEVHFPPEEFQGALLDWYGRAARGLPWRFPPGQKPDPYRVWLAEVMLQQTTVKVVMPYYAAFLQRWPTVQDLAAAPLEEVLAVWSGLGYYSRARNLHDCARIIAQHGFPFSEKELLRLPGIGQYTAAAIAAIAFGEPAAVVDGNVERVLARLFTLDAPPRSRKKVLKDVASLLTPRDKPGDYAQAMMDLGATVCTPRSPSCLACPITSFCKALLQGIPENFPRKVLKKGKPTRLGAALVLYREAGGKGYVLLRRRPEKGLLGGMMEVPSSQWSAEPDDDHWPTFPKEILDEFEPSTAHEVGTVRHSFSHFDLELRVFAAECFTLKSITHSGAYAWAPLQGLDNFALPSVMRKVIALAIEVFRPEALRTAPLVSRWLIDQLGHPPDLGENDAEKL